MAATPIIDLITQSLRKANIIGQNATPTAGQSSTALGELNRMFTRWEEDDIRLQYFVQTDVAADFPCPDYTHQGVIGMLAVALCGNYGRRVQPELSNGLGTGYADVGMATIMRKAMNDLLPRADLSHLPRGSGNRRGWDSER